MVLNKKFIYERLTLVRSRDVPRCITLKRCVTCPPSTASRSGECFRPGRNETRQREGVRSEGPKDLHTHTYPPPTLGLHKLLEALRSANSIHETFSLGRHGSLRRLRSNCINVISKSYI